MDFKGVSRHFGENFKQGPFKALKKKPRDFLKESQLLSNLKACFRGWVGDCDPPQGGLVRGHPVKSQHKIRKDGVTKTKNLEALKPSKFFNLIN